MIFSFRSSGEWREAPLAVAMAPTMRPAPVRNKSAALATDRTGRSGAASAIHPARDISISHVPERWTTWRSGAVATTSATAEQTGQRSTRPAPR
jgi:hypothetical protein